MTSLAKIESNRRNAAKSTGPRTQEGKDRSRRNALRHGLAAQTLIFTADEDEAEFVRFAADMTADLAPEGAVEEALAQRIVLCAWRLERVARIEADILSGEAELVARDKDFPPPVGIWPEEMSAIARYEAVLDRAFARAMKMFHERQQARLAGRLPDAAEITERSQAIAEITERTEADPHPPALPRGPLPLPLAGEGQKNPRPLAGEGAEQSEAGEGDRAAAADPTERSQTRAVPSSAAVRRAEVEHILDARFARVQEIVDRHCRAP